MLKIRQFRFALLALVLSASLGAAANAAASDSASGTFRFVVIGDTHIKDDTYVCCERGEDKNNTFNQSIYHTTEKLQFAIEKINAINPLPDFVVHVGDMAHNYFKPIDYYSKNKCHIDIANELLDGLKMPWYLAPGNHDVSKSTDPDVMSQLLFSKLGPKKIGEKGYMSFDHKGFRFILLNQYRCLAITVDSRGNEMHCIGRDQFDWLRGMLEIDMPVVLFMHEPPTKFK